MRGSGLGSIAVSGVIRRINMMGGAGKPRMEEKERGRRGDAGARGHHQRAAEEKVDRTAIWPRQGVKTAFVSVSASASYE